MYDVDPADPVPELDVADAADEMSPSVAAVGTGSDEAGAASVGDEAPGERDDDTAGPGESGGQDAADAPAGLDALAGAPLFDHPQIYERIHAELQGALAEIDGG